MNYLVLSEQNLVNNREDTYVVGDKSICAHLLNIIKARPGDELKIVLLNKGPGIAEVKCLSQDAVELSIKKLLPAQTRRLHLGLAGVRPLMAKRIFEHATTMGVKTFHFFNAELGEKSYFDSNVYEKDQYNKYFIKGVSQTGSYCTLPEVYRHKSLETIPFEQFENICFLDSTAQHYFDHDVEYEDDLLLLIGPERGWSDKEMLFLENKCFSKYKISESNLRVEFAVNASLAQMEYIRQSKEF